MKIREMEIDRKALLKCEECKKNKEGGRFLAFAFFNGYICMGCLRDLAYMLDEALRESKTKLVDGDAQAFQEAIKKIDVQEPGAWTEHGVRYEPQDTTTEPQEAHTAHLGPKPTPAYQSWNELLREVLESRVFALENYIADIQHQLELLRQRGML